MILSLHPTLSHLRNLILCIVAFSFCPLKAEEPRPNVLFIAADDLRPELGLYGARAITPNLDRLASKGLVFTRAYTNQAVCGASRTSLMTSMYPEYTGLRSAHVKDWREKIPDAITLNQLFQSQGYTTVGIGKIYHSWDKEKADGDNWDEWVATEGEHYYVDEATIELGKQQAKGYGVPFYRGPTTEAATTPGADAMYHDGFRARKAVELLKNLADTEDPFFLAVGFSKPHLPFSAPKRFWDLYDRDDFSMPEHQGVPAMYPDYARASTPGELRRYSDVPPSRDPREFPPAMNLRMIHGYHAAVSYMDENVGMVLQALQESGKSDNTIIVFWSDHGFKLGEHGSWCKHTNFEIDTRVPLIVVDPRTRNTRGQTQALVELIDLYPTLADLCGFPLPAQVQGRSFAKVLEDPSQPHRDFAYSSYPKRPDNDIVGHSIRNQQYRYTEWWDAETDGVLVRVATDLTRDPAETTNALLEKPELTEIFAPEVRRIVNEARSLPENE